MAANDQAAAGRKVANMLELVGGSSEILNYKSGCILGLHRAVCVDKEQRNDWSRPAGQLASWSG